VFLDFGFEGFSIEAVAARAEVSKVTIYKHFENRETLIGAIIGRESVWMEQFALSSEKNRLADVESLNAFGAQLIGFLARPDVVALDARMLQAPIKHRALVARYFEEGPTRLMQTLSTALGRAIENKLVSGEPDEMAGVLLALWLNAIPLPARLGLTPLPTSNEIEASVSRATAVFFKAFTS
jgi:AcrR family transcriptional regulator